MPDAIAFDDIDVVCDVLERTIAEGRGAAGVVARERGISASVVSNKLKRVEDFYGCVFIEGRTRTGDVTREGHAFLRRGQTVLDAYHQLLRDLGGPPGR